MEIKPIVEVFILFKYLLLAVTILFIGCSSQTSQNAISPELKQDATQIVYIMDTNMHKSQDLKGEDSQSYADFINKYDGLAKEADSANYLEQNGTKSKDLSQSIKLVQRIIKMREAFSLLGVGSDEDANEKYNGIRKEVQTILGLQY